VLQGLVLVVARVGRPGRKELSVMARRRRPSKDEERYWKVRTILEFVRVAAEMAWEVLRGGRGGLF
jgi:hypothetical protein